MPTRLNEAGSQLNSRPSCGRLMGRRGVMGLMSLSWPARRIGPMRPIRPMKCEQGDKKLTPSSTKTSHSCPRALETRRARVPVLRSSTGLFGPVTGNANRVLVWRRESDRGPACYGTIPLLTCRGELDPGRRGVLAASRKVRRFSRFAPNAPLNCRVGTVIPDGPAEPEFRPNRFVRLCCSSALS